MLRYTSPAFIIAVTLSIGCLASRWSGRADSFSSTGLVPVISVLAALRPTPLALGAAGLAAGLVLDIRRISSTSDDGPGSVNREMTLRGRVVSSGRGLNGLKSLCIRITDVLAVKSTPVDYIMNIDVPDRSDLKAGTNILFRADVQKHPTGVKRPYLTGRSVHGGWTAETSGVKVLSRGRERLGRALAPYHSHTAGGLLCAITMGERWRVDTQTRNILQRTGTYHLLAISGVHVAAAILPLFLLVRTTVLLIRRPDPVYWQVFLVLLSAGPLWIYLGYTGLSSSALRAVAFFFIAGTSVLSKREASPIVTLSWCVMGVVCFSRRLQPDPALIMSALAVMGIIVSSRGYRESGASGVLMGSIRMTLGACLFTLPVGIWLSSGISAASLLGNLAGGLPFGLLLIPYAVLLDLASLFPEIPLDPLICGWLASAETIICVMKGIAGLPFSFRYLSVPGCLAAVVAVVSGVFWWRKKGYRVRAGLAVFMLTIVISNCVDILWKSAIKNHLIIDFPAVGQADAAVIRAGGHTVLVDCGPPGKPGRDSPAASAMKRLGIERVDALFLSHAHPDHSGGLEDIMTLFPVERVFIPSEPGVDSRTRDRIYNIAAGAEVEVLERGNTVEIAPMSFEVLGPFQGGPLSDDPNRGSMLLFMKTGGYQALFTGDAGWDQVAKALEEVSRLNLLKIPHHGSRTGFTSDLLEDAIRRISKGDEFMAVCPSKPPGCRPLPAREVVNWFHKKGILLVYTGNNGIKFMNRGY